MNRKRLLLLTMPLLIASQTFIFAGTLRKDFDKRIRMPDGSLIDVQTVNGKINVDSWRREEVRIHADIEVKARSRRQAEAFMKKVRIIVERDGDELRIEPEYPKKKGGGFFDAIFGRKTQVKIDFQIRLPEESDLNLRTVNGNLEIEDVRGDMRFKSTNGSITAHELAGSLDAGSTNGSVRIEMVDVRHSDTISLRTTNGGVRLTLPRDIEADVKASTVNGGISTDFPLNLRGKYSSKRLSGTINGGGCRIELKTTNGGIRIIED